MPSDVRIWDGTSWVSLRGPEGPAGPTVVSTDAGNVAKLGADGRISVQPADLDARFVNVTGDTMTGTLNIAGLDGVTTGFTVTSTNASALAQVARYDSTTAGAQFQLLKVRGTPAAPLPILSGDIIGNFAYQTRNTGGTNVVAGYHRVVSTAAPGANNTACVMQFGVGDGTTALAPIVMTIRPTGVDVAGNINSTGQVVIQNPTPITVPDGAFRLVGDNLGANISLQHFSNVATTTNGIRVTRARGSAAAPTAVQLGDFTSAWTAYGMLPSGTYGQVANMSTYISQTPAAGDTSCIGELRFGMGAGTTTVRPLTLTKDGGAVAGTLSVTGNITSSGTAHNFAANSIPASAILGLPVAASTAPLDPSSVAAAGSLTTYARADHQHKLPTYAALGPLPVAATGQAGAVKAGTGLNLAVDGTISVAPISLKADDLTDVAVTTPAAGQVLRWNGTNFVNAALNYSDLTGTAPGGGGLSQADADNRYVNISGDTVTGDLIINGKVGVGVTPLTGFHVKSTSITLEGYVSSQAVRATAPSNFGGVGVIDSQSIVSGDATAATGSCTAVLARTRGADFNPAVPRVGDFAFKSEGPAPSQLAGSLTVLGNLIGERPFIPLTSGRVLSLDERSAAIANVSTGAATVTLSIPLNTSAAFPIGSRLEILDLSATSATVISALAGVTLNWNAALTGSAAAVAGGAGASLTLPGPFYQVTLMKTATDTWVVLN